jgi:hypothetical protein
MAERQLSVAAFATGTITCRPSESSAVRNYGRQYTKCGRCCHRYHNFLKSFSGVTGIVALVTQGNPACDATMRAAL